MGGFGSGRFHGRRPTPVVEDHLTLDVNALSRTGIIGAREEGMFVWRHRPGTPAVSYGVEAAAGGLLIVLRYRPRLIVGMGADAVETSADAAGGDGDVTCPIRLETTRPPFGGVRWWFRCPSPSAGRSCGRRVCQLYLRNGHFGCRHCHGLTYLSSRHAHRDARRLAKLGLRVRPGADGRKLLAAFRGEFRRRG